VRGAMGTPRCIRGRPSPNLGYLAKTARGVGIRVPGRFRYFSSNLYGILTSAVAEVLFTDLACNLCAATASVGAEVLFNGPASTLHGATASVRTEVLFNGPACNPYSTRDSATAEVSARLRTWHLSGWQQLFRRLLWLLAGL
jgi:hypothetical protein